MKLKFTSKNLRALLTLGFSTGVFFTQPLLAKGLKISENLLKQRLILSLNHQAHEVVFQFGCTHWTKYFFKISKKKVVVIAFSKNMPRTLN